MWLGAGEESGHLVDDISYRPRGCELRNRRSTALAPEEQRNEGHSIDDGRPHDQTSRASEVPRYRMTFPVLDAGVAALWSPLARQPGDRLGIFKLLSRETSFLFS